MCLRLPNSLTRGLSTCPNSKCSATVDPEGLHFLMCNKGPGYVRLHDSMVRAWAFILLEETEYTVLDLKVQGSVSPTHYKRMRSYIVACTVRCDCSVRALRRQFFVRKERHAVYIVVFQ